MSRVRVPLAALVACASVFAAGQAGAVTKLVFEITGDNPAVGTFQQTWTLQDGTAVSDTSGAPFVSYGYIGDATASASPVTSALLTQTHVTSYNETSFDFTRGIDQNDPNDGSIGFFLEQAGQATYDVTKTQDTQSNYSVSIFASSSGLTLPAGEPTLADLIAYLSTPGVDFLWDEHVDASNFKVKNDVYLGDVFNQDYFGTARLISVDYGGSPAPEPSAWALMILGFGAAGSALRRRFTRAVA